MNASISGNAFSNIAGEPGDPDQTVMRLAATGSGGTFNVAQLAPSPAANPSELDDANAVSSGQVAVEGAVQFGQPAPPAP